MILTDKDDLHNLQRICTCLKGPVPVRSSHLLSRVCGHPLTGAICIMIHMSFQNKTSTGCVSFDHVSTREAFTENTAMQLYPQVVPNSKTQVVSRGFFLVSLLYPVARNWKCSCVCIPASINKATIFLPFWSTAQASANNFAWPLLKTKH